MRRMLLVLACGLAAHQASAAPPGQNPDWPCFQRLVPKLAAGSYWSGPPMPANVDWRADPAVGAVVQAAAPREIPIEDGVAKLRAFAEHLDPAQRRTELPEVFAGLVDESNRQREAVIRRIEDLSRRQHNIADQVAALDAKANAIPEDATGADAKRRADLLAQRDFVIRSFQEVQHTMRYACEVPADFDRRLGEYARTLQAALE